MYKQNAGFLYFDKSKRWQHVKTGCLSQQKAADNRFQMT